TEAFYEVYVSFASLTDRAALEDTTRNVFNNGRSLYDWSIYHSARGHLLDRVDDVSLSLHAVRDREGGVRAYALKHLIKRQPDDEQTWHLVKEAAETDVSNHVRGEAVEMLASASREWATVLRAAQTDGNTGVRLRALR